MLELCLQGISVLTSVAYSSPSHVDVALSACCCMCLLYHRENETRVDKMHPSSLCNYLPIFSPSVAFIIPFRSHLRVGDCHTAAPPSLKVCRMKCRSLSIDLCLTAPAFLSPYLFPRNTRHLEIRIIINQRSLQLFMQSLWRRQWMDVTF